MLIEYNNFDYLVSGDLTGGGSTSTAKTPDVETYVGQMVGDVDVVQLNHHGSTTTNNQTFLSALKAEVAVRADRRDQHLRPPEPRDRQQVPQHARHRSATRFTGTGVPPATGIGPGLLSERSQSCRRRSGDATGLHRRGRGQRAARARSCCRPTARRPTRSAASTTAAPGFRPAQHTYAVDGVSAGLTTDFKPTVVVQHVAGAAAGEPKP